MKWIRELSRLEPFYSTLGIDSNSWGYPGSVDKLQQRFNLEELPPPGPMPNFSYQDYEEIRYAQNGTWARDQVTEGTHFARAGNHEEAIKCYNKALFTHPDCHEARIARGASKANMLDLKGAVHDFKRALEICPTDPFALKYLKQTMKKLAEVEGNSEPKEKKAVSEKPLPSDPEPQSEDKLAHYHDPDLQDPRIVERSKTGKFIGGGRTGLVTHRPRDPLQVPLDLLRRNRRYPESQLPSLHVDSSRFNQLNDKSPERLTSRQLIRNNLHRSNVYRPDGRATGSHSISARPYSLVRPPVDKDSPSFVPPISRNSLPVRATYRSRGSFDEVGTKFARAERPHDPWNTTRPTFTTEAKPATIINTSVEVVARPPRPSYSMSTIPNKNDPNYDPFWDPEPKPKFNLSGSNQYIPPESKLRTQPQYSKIIEAKPQPQPAPAEPVVAANSSIIGSNSTANDPFWGKPQTSPGKETQEVPPPKPQTEADIKDPALDPFWSKDIPSNDQTSTNNENSEIVPDAGAAAAGSFTGNVDKSGFYDQNINQPYRGGYRGRGNPYYRGMSYRPRPYNPNYRPYRPRGYHYQRGGYSNYHYSQAGGQFQTATYQPAGWDAANNDPQANDGNPNFSPTNNHGGNGDQNQQNQQQGGEGSEWENQASNMNNNAASGWGSPNFT